MPQIKQTPQFRKDIERLRTFLENQQGSEVAQLAAVSITEALRALQKLPEGFAPVLNYPHLRELIIPFRSKGYKVLYRYTKSTDTIDLLAMKHQLENDYQ